MDWQTLINDLDASGMTQAEIGRRCGCSQNYVSDLKRGVCKGVGYDLGAALVALWRERCATKRRPNPPRLTRRKAA